MMYMRSIGERVPVGGVVERGRAAPPAAPPPLAARAQCQLRTVYVFYTYLHRHGRIDSPTLLCSWVSYEQNTYVLVHRYFQINNAHAPLIVVFPETIRIVNT